ncbi:hypothetical protein BDZ91DRAFT_760307 [Kalaharituber pfeilii]|nr:hypothetical protein BDZ91DRAFT_760307 [Kalaharituber pfeilii]
MTTFLKGGTEIQGKRMITKEVPDARDPSDDGADQDVDSIDHDLDDIEEQQSDAVDSPQDSAAEDDSRNPVQLPYRAGLRSRAFSSIPAKYQGLAIRAEDIVRMTLRIQSNYRIVQITVKRATGKRTINWKKKREGTGTYLSYSFYFFHLFNPLCYLYKTEIIIKSTLGPDV